MAKKKRMLPRMGAGLFDCFAEGGCCVSGQVGDGVGWSVQRAPVWLLKFANPRCMGRDVALRGSSRCGGAR
jgi:hypothetical protein